MRRRGVAISAMCLAVVSCGVRPDQSAAYAGAILVGNGMPATSGSAPTGPVPPPTAAALATAPREQIQPPVIDLPPPIAPAPADPVAPLEPPPPVDPPPADPRLEAGAVLPPPEPPPPASPDAALAAAVQRPAYEIIAKRWDRTEKKNSYYVVIAPVDLNTENFKEVVRSVFRVLAQENGGPLFTAHVWTLKSAAQTELSYASQPYTFSDDLFSAKEAANDQHFLASYIGGLVYAGEAPENLIYWFPSSAHPSPNVGRWVGAEVWEPI